MAVVDIRPTNTYDLDEVVDPDELRRVAATLRAAFLASREQTAHLLYADCEPCKRAWLAVDSALACPAYRNWQQDINDGVGAI